jgi:hypothetical protein
MSVRRLLLLVVTVLAAAHAGLALASPASAAAVAPASKPAHCLQVDATGLGQDLGGGQTAATLFVGGVAVGTTSAAFTVTGVDGSLASFTGAITFTGRGGTLTAQVAGTLDLATGAFTSTSTALSGNGAFRGVTGSVTLSGVEDLATGAFTETVTGVLCQEAGSR